MKLNDDNYFSREMQEKYMSVSQFKDFERCPAAALAFLHGEYEREKTAPLLIGSYVDSYFDGSLERFGEENPQIFRRDGSLKTEFKKAEEIIERVSRDRMFTDFMSGENQVIMTGEISGVPVKIKIDSLHKDKIVDLKIMRNFSSVYVREQGLLPWYEAWRYDLQGAVYQEIVRQNTGRTLPFYLAAATKETVTDIGIWHIGDELLAFELERFAENVVYYDYLKKGAAEPERCEKCDYCKQTKILTEIQESGKEIIYD